MKVNLDMLQKDIILDIIYNTEEVRNLLIKSKKVFYVGINDFNIRYDFENYNSRIHDIRISLKYLSEIKLVEEYGFYTLIAIDKDTKEKYYVRLD